MMRRPPFLTGPSLKRAVTIELNAFTTRAPGASAATTSLAPLSPRSASTSLGLYWMNGFVASISTRPFHASESGPRRLLNTTSWPAASASRANASATVPAPIVPNFMLSLSVSREIDQNDAGAAGPADMRHRVGDPGGRIALGNLESGHPPL